MALVMFELKYFIQTPVLPLKSCLLALAAPVFRTTQPVKRRFLPDY